MWFTASERDELENTIERGVSDGVDACLSTPSRAGGSRFARDKDGDHARRRSSHLRCSPG